LSGTKGVIATASATPTTCTQRGPDAYAETVKVDFTTINGLYEEGKIVVTLGSAWGVTSASTCTTTASFATGGGATLSGSTCTVTKLNAAAAGSVSVSFTNVLPPNSSSSAAHWTLIKTTTKDDNTVDESTATVTACATPTAANAVGKSTFNTASTLVPSNAGYTGADLYLKFSLGKTTPSGSDLKITSPTGSWVTSGTDTKDHVYLSKKYSSVSINGAVLTLTLTESISAGAEVELYVESALTFGDSVTTTGNFLVETTYASVTINQDTTALPGTNTNLALTTKAAGTISGGSSPITTNTNSALEMADWKFSFASNQAFVSGDQFWVQFPQTFDPQLGGGHIKYSQEPTVYYIPCISEALGSNVECVIDRWYLKVWNAAAVDANTNIDLEVQNVTNPEALSSTGDFKLFHINGWSAKAVGTLTGVTIRTYPANITVKKVMTSNTRLFGSGDYTFELYVGTNLTSDHSLELYLPRQYDTGLARNNQAISCSLAYVNHADDSATLDEQSVSGVSSCNTNDNWIEMGIPTGGVTTGSNIKLVYRVTSLKNPEWGYTRSNSSSQKWNFDSFDFDVYTEYARWTDQIVADLYHPADDYDIAKSYANVNGAYLGFTKRSRFLKVNNYGAMLMTNRVVVNPGTQTSDLLLTFEDNEFLAAKKLVVTPSTNSHTSDSGKLSFTSAMDNFTMVYEEDSIYFRIGAAIDLSQGLYWIDYAIDETKQDGQTDTQYDYPVKTLVEVTDGTTKVSFTVEDLPTVGVGNSTRPLCISTINAPHKEVTIDVALSNSDVTGVTFTPNSITFTPNVNRRCFRVAVSSDYSIETNSSQQTVTFTLSGTDAAAYSAIAAKTLTISSVAVTEAGNVTTCRSTDPARTSASLTASADSAGILYVQVAAKGAPVASQSEIETNVGDVFYLESNPTTSTVEKTDFEPSESDISHARLDPWTSFQRRKLEENLAARWYFGASVQATTSTVVATLNSLRSGVTYQSSCYIVNASENSSAVLTETWTTDATDAPVYFNIQLAGEIAESYTSGIRNAAAARLGVNIYRLMNPTRTTSRRLQGTTITNTDFRFTVGQARGVEGPSPSEIANINSDAENSALLSTELRTLITGYGTSSALTYSQSSVAAATTPQWITGAAPALSGSPTTSSITASMQCNVSGEICGVCEATSSTSNAITHDQILASVDSNGVSTTKWNCIDYASTDESTTITISNLSAGTSYRCSYQCYNTYPVFPGYVSYTEDDRIDFFTATTAASEDEEDDDFASYQLQSILGLLLVLVF
jgi:hypothetical protein